MSRAVWMFLLVLLVFGATAIEALAHAPDAKEEDKAPDKLANAPPAVARHAITLGATTLEYETMAEFLELRNESGKVVGHLFAIAYERSPAAGGRPVTFAFNGGPGAASAFLHLGALGPKVVATGPDGRISGPKLVENPSTWLGFTDLVFLDPIGTGFSRPATGVTDPGELFHGVDADLRSLGAAIRVWLTEHGRWGDPVYLAGESYGGFRAAAMAARLRSQIGLAIEGAVLISPALDFSTIYAEVARPVPWALVLPSLVATARSLDLIEGEVPTSGEVEAFALGTYLDALVRPELMGRAVPTIARWIGMPQDWVAVRNGRIDVSDYRRSLLRDRSKLVSGYDGTVVAPDPEPLALYPTIDPILDGVIAPLTTAFLAYADQELQWQDGGRYELLNGEISGRWDYGGAEGQGFVGALDEIREALSLDPGLRFLVVHGETDLVTPYFASEWLIGQLASELPAAADAIDLQVLPGGHMMYFDPDARARLADAAQRLVRETSP